MILECVIDTIANSLVEKIIGSIRHCPQLVTFHATSVINLLLPAKHNSRLLLSWADGRWPSLETMLSLTRRRVWSDVKTWTWFTLAGTIGCRSRPKTI